MDTATQNHLNQICKVIVETIDVRAVYLFGSYAKGTQRADSDYDLYVVLPDDGPRPIIAIQQIRKALFGIQEKPMDILAGKESVFTARAAAATMERAVLREGVPLYESDLGRVV